MKDLIRRLWHSPTAMGMLSQMVGPLRMLVLAPLVLTRMGKLEMDVYYLLAGASVLTGLVAVRLTDVFSTMLSFAFGGVSDLSPKYIRVESKCSKGEPDWKAFGTCMAALGRLEVRLLIPLIAISLALVATGLLRLIPIHEWSCSIWVAVLLGITGTHLELVRCHVDAAMIGSGGNSLRYRLHTAIALGFIVVASLALICGAGIAGVFGTQTLAALVRFAVFKRALKLPAEGMAAWQQGRKQPDVRILKWAWPPLWRSTLTVFSHSGVQRLAGLFIVSLAQPGLVASFSFAQNIMFTICATAFALVTSQLPRYSTMIVRQEEKSMVLDGCRRMALAFYLCLLAITVGALTLPWLFKLIGSHTPFPPLRIWLGYGIGFLLLNVMQTWSMICARTNEVVFYGTFVAAAGVAIAGLWLSSLMGSIDGMVLSLTLPYLLGLNLRVGVHLARLGGLSVSSVFASTFNPMGVVFHLREVIASFTFPRKMTGA